MVLGCTKAPPAPTVHPASSETITDGDVTFDFEIGWQSVGTNDVQIIVELIAKSIEQSENLVVDVSTNGFVITEGGAQWVGFVQPRERYKHTVTYGLLDGEESGRVTVTLRHSMDGSLLWDEELLFRKEGSAVVLAQ